MPGVRLCGSEINAVRNIIAYHKATKDLGAVFRRGGELELEHIADTDYADRCNGRRSVWGVVVISKN